MTVEEMNRIMGVNPDNVWMPDYDYGEISEEENEELTRLLESLTEDDLQTARIVRCKLSDPDYEEVIYVNEDILNECA